MKILLVMPDARIHRLDFGGFRMSLREAPLTLTTLAALVPADLGATVTLWDESVQARPPQGDFDLVGISCLTGTSLRAYELAARYRALGAAVVLGGVHVTLMTEEAARHADALVIGFAEQSWPRLLRDFASGVLQARYRQEGTELRGLPWARRDLQRRHGYSMPNTVFATRGCRAACDFCSVSAAAFGWHTRPVEEVLAEVRSLPGRHFAFNDVNLVDDRAYALELFRGLRPLKKIWGGLASVRIADDPELLDAMAQSGCVYLLLGYESLSSTTLGSIRKGFNAPAGYAKVSRELHRRGILIQGCFVFGFDHDTPEVFDRTLQAVQDLRIDIPRYAIYTPYPGTPIHRRLKAEKRLLHEIWRHYDTQHVVFRPAQMSPRQLDRGFRELWDRTFRFGSIARRLGGSRYLPITLVGNLAYRLYVRRLRLDSDRILAPKEAADAPVVAAA